MGLILRFFAFALFVYLGIEIYRIIIKAALKKQCPVCNGKGSWEGTRERVECADCDGTGKIKKR